MNGKLLSLDQVAEYLGVHRDTVYKLVRSGRLPALQLGGRKAGWRVAEEDLQQFVDASKANTAAARSHAEEAELEAFDAAQVQEGEAFKNAQAHKRETFLREQRESR